MRLRCILVGTKMMGLSLNYNLINKSVLIKVGLITWLILPVFHSLHAQHDKARWVDSVFSTLSLEQKIGQLFFISVSPNDEENKRERDLEWIRNHGVGGVLISSGGPQGVLKWLNRLQQEAAIPLLVGINAEEGLGTTLDSTMVFPPTLALGSVTSDSALYFLGHELARQLRLLGIHFNLAPTTASADLFQTADLYYHSWGDNPERYARLAAMYAQGMRSGGVLPVIKYFPKDVAGLSGNRTAASSAKSALYTGNLFRQLSPICSGTIIAYSHNPDFTSGSLKAKATESAYPLIFSAEWLKQNTAFSGLAFAYLPDVREALQKSRAGDAEWYALLTGSDVLVEPQSLPVTLRRLRNRIIQSPQQLKRLNESVRKILEMKFDAGLIRYKPAAVFRHETLNSAEAGILKRKLTEQSLVLLENNDLIPVTHLDQKNIAVINIGEREHTPFSVRISAYARITTFSLQLPGDTTGLMQQLSRYNIIIAGLYPYAKPVLDILPDLLEKQSGTSKIILCNFTSPEVLPLPGKVHALIQAWNDTREAQQAAAGAIFGGLACTGRLPVRADGYAVGSGLNNTTLDVLQFAEPEEVEMNCEVLRQIDRVAREAIDEKATPGCQIVVVRKGKVVYHRSFGWLTYNNDTPVNDQTIYDLASVTKVAATLQAVMFLYEKRMIDLNKKVSVYLPEMQKTNKKDIILKDVLTHQAGLVPFEPWYPLTMKDTMLLPHYYSRIKSPKYPLQVAPNLYAATHIRDSVWKWTLQSRMLNKPDRTPYPFRYSDLSFIILHRLAEKLLNQPLDDFLKQNLYEPLGAASLGFNPLTWANPNNIAPTEYDKIFRKQWIAGTVHDERAAMLGGVSGHAGLFGNAIDLAKLGQMLLQKGSYGGVRYYKPETVELFSTRQHETSRRGLGWDKPMLSDYTSPTSFYASSKTYGHTGFTGTCIWIDPEFDLVYVFLSNRTYPDRSSKLISLNIRSRIQDIIYQSIFEYCAAPNPLPWNALK